MANTTTLVIGLAGEIIDKTNGYLVAGNAYSNMIQIVAPFPSSDSVKLEFYLRNARIKTYNQYIELMKDNTGTPILAKDVIPSTKPYYQTVKEWYVWQSAVDSKVLAAIFRYHAGKVDLTAKFYEFRNTYVEEAVNYIGTFGSPYSFTGGDLPATATIGDWYKCDFLDYYSYQTSTYYTLEDYAYYTASGWIKGKSYQWRRNSASTEIQVDPGVQGQDLDEISLNVQEQFAARISDLESVIHTLAIENYVEDSFVRDEFDLLYPKLSPILGTDKLVLERDRVLHYTDVDDIFVGVNEIDSDIIRTSSALDATTGTGLYADENNVLIGSATGTGITWDGVDLFIRGTLQAAQITDPVLLEQLKGADGQDGADGYTPVKGVDYFDGNDGQDGQVGNSFNYLGVLALLSDLTLISNPAKADAYRIDETDELWQWSGSTWTNMGKIKGDPGTDGSDGQPVYLHIAYSTSSDGTADFSTTSSVGKTYIGTYSDNILQDSNDPTSYKWSLFKGEPGTDGSDGTSVVLKGSVATIGDLPVGATIGDLYVVLADGNGYVWNGSAWDNVGQIQGPDGEKGDPGDKPYIHYAYSTSSDGTADFSTTPFANASYIGDYIDYAAPTDPAPADSTDPADYTWKLYKGPQGDPGLNGEDAKFVRVSGKQVFKFLKDATTPVNTSILLSAELFGDLTVYDWEYYTGTIWSNLGGINNSNTYTLSYDNAAWGTNTELRVRCLSGTSYDEITILKMYDGATGEDAVSGFLTQGNVSVPAKSDGTGYDTSSISGTFKVFYGLTDVTTSSTFSVTNATIDGLTLSIDANTGVYTLETPDDTWTTDGASFELTATYGSVTLSKIFTITKTKVGLSGPGLIFRGEFDDTESYYKDLIRQDVVKYLGSYYAAKDNIIPGAFNSSEWEVLASFASVATDILLAQNATITKGLVMGDGTNNGFIRSYNKTALGTGDGFYLSGDGKLNIGSSTGNNIDWDGTNLTIKGDIQANSLDLLNNATITKGLTMGNDTTKGFIASYGMSSLTDTTGGYFIDGDGKFVFGKPGYSSLEWDGTSLSINQPFEFKEWYAASEDTLSLEITNNTDTGHTYYGRYTEDAFGSSTPTAWSSLDYIPAGNTEYSTIGGLEFGKGYYVEVRQGLDDSTIQGKYMFTSNVLVNGGSFTGWGISVSGGAGGSLNVETEQAVKSSTSEIWTASGTVTIGSNTETATITTPYSLYYPTIQVTVKSDNSGGSGLDGAYGKFTTSPATQFEVTHDYTNTNNSTVIYWQITGYVVSI